MNATSSASTSVDPSRFTFRLSRQMTGICLAISLCAGSSALAQSRPPEAKATQASEHRGADMGTGEGSTARQEPLPSKVRKNLARAVRDLESGQMKDAEKKLANAYQQAPASSEVNFVYGSFYFRRSDFDRAQAHLVAATKADPQNTQAFTLLGRTQLRSKDYASAAKTLEEAVRMDPENWNAHNLLAESYLKQNEPQKAKEQAELAVEKSHGASSAAAILLAEADTHLGKKDEAIAILQNYLEKDTSNPDLADVRDILTNLKRTEISQAAESQDLAQVLGDMDKLVSAMSPVTSIQTWHPIGVDASQPPVAPGVNCPADRVIEQAGERVKELVDGLSRFDATESMIHEDLDEFGVPKSRTSLKFDYVAAITEKKPGVLLVDEYRTWKSQGEDFPDHIATRGLPALAFVFHPELRDNFEMKCEGLGSWNGAATWLVHFQQREDKPHHTQEYVVNGHVFPVSVKGRAWIGADNFQIVRLESDLVRPIPEIQLFSQHWSVDYGPVHFTKQNQDLWLPKNADLYFDFLKHRYYRRHTFDHFMLFSVDTEEKRKEPVVPGSEVETQHRPRGFGTILVSQISPAWLLSQ